MTEAELVEKLAEALFLRPGGDDTWQQTVREKLLPIIQSHTDAQIAGERTDLERQLAELRKGQ